MDIVFYVSLLLFVLFGPWILVWRMNRGRKQNREEDQSRWRELTNRVLALELALKELRSRAALPSGPKPLTKEAPVGEPRPAPPRAAPAGPTQPEAETLVSPNPVQQPTTPPPLISSSAAASIRLPSLAQHLKSSLDLEETLGTNWLNKLGIAILVLGVAFFLAYQLKTLGPAGKVLVGYAVGGLLLGAGVWFERHDLYRILARAGVGGGWALLFFTTYALYHVPAAQVLTSQLTDLVLMLAVATVMVWHTLRYRSQVVTGLAFLLAFLTVTVSHSNVYSLSAGALLAAGLVVIVGRMQWFEMEIFGILASYLNHYLWLRPIIESMGGHRHPFPEFAASAGILALYWLVFRVSYLLRQPQGERQERISTVAALLNTILLLLLFKYQSAHPEWAFWALLTIGAIETALGQLPVTRRRRSAVIVLSTVGTVLLVVAFPFRYSGMRLSVFWLLEAEALLLIGVWTGEIVFRRLGAVATLFAAGHMISVDAARVYGMRMDDADLRSHPRVAALFAVAAIVFYTNAHWVSRRWSGLFEHEFDRRLMARLSYAGAFMAFTGAWIFLPEAWSAVAWAALGLGLALARRRWTLADLGYQANLLAAGTVVRALSINLNAATKFHGVTQRLISIVLVTALLYITSRWSWAAEDGRGLTFGTHLFSARQVVGGAYTWTASFLLALVTWYELRPVGVAVAWMVGGLILLEAGLSRKSLQLRLQGYAAFAASFLRIWFVNLNASGSPGEISPRFYTLVPLTLAFFYAYWRLHEAGDHLRELERKYRAADFCCWLGTITLAALMRFELPADWVATAWAALALALLAVAWRSGRRLFLHQALLVGAGVLMRTVLHNFYERSYFPAPVLESRWLCVGTAVALLFLSLPILFQLRRKGMAELPEGIFFRVLIVLGRRPEQVFFFIALTLLTVLLALEMRHGMVTLSWGVEGVAVFLLALWLSERSFRLSGLGLLLLCVGKIIVVDVWRLNPRDRYLTFIVLGIALLLVSYLYTRNRETLRQYL
ncbi:MAG: hypothetical protein AUG07_06775 [Acidobacteria bacterium 13_1_20CM_2_60_10]|nr:MAG: hypothetical protein AUG07_06775 [Acidobacteria bacterium 13_1_20CM_2_60_10]